MKKFSYRVSQRFFAVLALSLILAMVSVGATPAPGRAAGILTHTEIVERAIDTLHTMDKNAEEYEPLGNLLIRYEGVVNYGSMYPDWPYILDRISPNPAYGNLAEAAHEGGELKNSPDIPPFRESLIRNILPLFRKSSLQEQEEKAIAFLFGIIAHQEADIPWHLKLVGDGVSGFEEAAKDAYGGDKMEINVDWIVYDGNPIEWWYPEEFVIDAYRAKSWTLDGTVLSVGREAQMGQYSLELGLDPYPWWTQIFLAEQKYYIEWFLPGGMQDCADWTKWAWRQTYDLLKPVTRLRVVSPAAPDGINGWYRQPVTVALDTTDYLNGEVETWYNPGSDYFQQYANPFTVSAYKAISYYSQDVAGHSWGIQEQAVKVDTSTPWVEITGPSQDIITGSPDITIRGEVWDETYNTVTMSVDGGPPEIVPMRLAVMASPASVSSPADIPPGPELPYCEADCPPLVVFEKALTFTEQITHVIVVTAMDQAGSTSTVTRNVTYLVDSVPDAFTFTARTGVELSTVISSGSATISGMTVPASISILSCPDSSCEYSLDGGTTWTTAAGTVTNGSSVMVRMESAGTNSIRRTMTLNIGGVSGTFRVTTMANRPPTAAFAPATPSLSGWTVTVTDASTDPDGNLSGSSAITVAWGDGATSRCASLGTVTHTYASAGTYTIKLTAMDASGLTDTVSATTGAIALGKVTGTVTSGGVPVSMAKVQLTRTGGPNPFAYTNVSGVYTISNVKPGAVTLTATKGTTNYGTQSVTVVSGINTVNFP